MTAYYNEIDEYAAQWLRNLIKAGHIAPGDVDTRSIEDVTPDDLKHYTQCHFFAGIGVWSYALRRAGWPDDRQVWTGSCPCQPFSVAGKGDGFADERHLWPAFHWLIEQRRPLVVFGEQVASKDGYAWLDLVQADLEGTGYTVGAVVAPAAGFGAPHQRHRMYWAADSLYAGLEKRISDGRVQRSQVGTPQGETAECGSHVGGLADSQLSGAARHGQHSGTGAAASRVRHGLGDSREPGGLADTNGRERDGFANGEGRIADGQTAGRKQGDREPQRRGTDGGLEYPGGDGRESRRAESGRVVGGRRPGGTTIDMGTGATETNGFWSAADWIYCRDEKYRPVEPGSFPLVDWSAKRMGSVCADQDQVKRPSRVGMLRAYGNAIVAPQATEFIKAFLEVRP